MAEVLSFNPGDIWVTNMAATGWTEDRRLSSVATWILEPLRSLGSDTAHGGQLDVGTAEPRAEWCAEIFSPQEGMQDGSRGREYNVWKERSLLKCVHGAVEEARDNANCRAALPRRAHAHTHARHSTALYIG